MNPIIKIKGGTQEKKVPRSVGMGAVGVAKARAVGIAMFAVVLGSLGISVAKKKKRRRRRRKMMMCKTVKGLY